jgi:hypothetical protein
MNTIGRRPLSHWASLTAAVTNQLPKDDSQTVLVARYNQSALRSGLGHSLKVDCLEAVVPGLSDASTTTGGYFLWDNNNNNGLSELTPNGFLSLIPVREGRGLRDPGPEARARDARRLRRAAWACVVPGDGEFRAHRVSYARWDQCGPGTGRPIRPLMVVCCVQPRSG